MELRIHFLLSHSHSDACLHAMMEQSRLQQNIVAQVQFIFKFPPKCKSWYLISGPSLKNLF